MIQLNVWEEMEEELRKRNEALEFYETEKA